MVPTSIYASGRVLSVLSPTTVLGCRALPSLRWGRGPAPEAWISSDRPRAALAERGIAQLGKREASATPAEFRDVLLAMAGSTRARQMREGA